MKSNHAELLFSKKRGVKNIDTHRISLATPHKPLSRDYFIIFTQQAFLLCEYYNNYYYMKSFWRC